MRVGAAIPLSRLLKEEEEIRDVPPFEGWPGRIRRKTARRWLKYWAGQVERGWRGKYETQMLYTAVIDGVEWSADITEPSHGRDGPETWEVGRKEPRRRPERRTYSRRGGYLLKR